MKRTLLVLIALMAAAVPAAAQARSDAWQVAAAVLPLPDSMRAGAVVTALRTCSKVAPAA